MLRDVSTGYLARARESADGPSLANPLRVFESEARAVRPIPPFFAPVGTRDPILDDTRRLARALGGRSVRCDARYYPGEIHAFHALAWRPLARQCWADMFEFLDSVLGDGVVEARAV